jgi:hypothetical protein
MEIRYVANMLPGRLSLPTLYVYDRTAEELAEIAAAAHWRDHPEDRPTPITVVHIENVEGRDLGVFEVRCEWTPIFTATLFQQI